MKWLTLKNFSNYFSKKKIEKNIFIKKKSFNIIKLNDMKSKFGSDYFPGKFTQGNQFEYILVIF